MAKKAIIGSYHFVFEDENSIIPEGMEEKFRHLPEEYSHLYLALEGVLAAVICIEDPLRPEAAEIIRQLKKNRSEKDRHDDRRQRAHGKSDREEGRRGRVLC